MSRHEGVSFHVMSIYQYKYVTKAAKTHRLIIAKAPFTLYRITSERSDFHTGLGCCLHYTTPIRYAPRSENHSALEVIQKVIRYVPEQCKQ